MKKSSKAHENLNKNDTNPIHKANIAKPWKRFLKFLIFVLLSTLFSSISMYLGIFSVTGAELNNLVVPSPLGFVDKDQKSTGSTVI